VQSNFKLLPASLQKEFVKYSIMFYGGRFGSSNFVMTIPAQNYVKFSKDYAAYLKKVVQLNKNESFDVSKDLMEVQIMINLFDKLFTFNKEAINEVSNASLQLNTEDGETLMYYDMWHSKNVKPTGFQPEVSTDSENQGDDTKKSELQ